MPPVSRYMTMHPFAIGPRDKLSAARRLMTEHHVKHLPVLEDERLVGIVSDRDLHPVHPLHDIAVADTMTEDVVTVPRETPIDEVIELMEARGCGSILVVDAGQVEGIFTLTDALHALGDVLRRNVENQP